MKEIKLTDYEFEKLTIQYRKEGAVVIDKYNGRVRRTGLSEDDVKELVEVYEKLETGTRYDRFKAGMLVHGKFSEAELKMMYEEELMVERMDV